MKAVAFVVLALIASSLLTQPRIERASFRPAPTSLDTSLAVEELGREIRFELGSRRIRGTVCGVKVFNITTDRDIFSLRPNDALTPASTMKLFTSSAALGLFGPSYKVSTDILADSLAGHEVVGNLYLKGHGDPTLTANDLDSLVDVLKSHGITRISGDVVGDDSFYDDVVDRATYSGDGEMVEPLPPISALSINRNAITVVAHAGARGERVRLQTVPHVPAIALTSAAMSVAPRHSARAMSPRGRKHKRYGHRTAETLSGSPKIIGAAYILPAAHRRIRSRRASSGLRWSVSRGGIGKQSVVVSGALGVGSTSSCQVTLSNPALAAASMLLYRLESNGIKVEGTAKEGIAPDEVVKLCAKETPLVDILAMLNKHSDNFAAEQVFKMIGAVECAPVPHIAIKRLADSSVKYIKEYLYQCKINPLHYEIHDGSGLSRRAAVTPDTKVALLRTIHATDSLFRAFYPTLAIGGVDGTIRHRMRGTLAENNVHAKTGTLRNVSALAGYVTTRDGELWAFDITMNAARVNAGRDVQDKIVEKLAEFSYAAK